jgi:hypothetical protein
MCALGVLGQVVRLRNQSGELRLTPRRSDYFNILSDKCAVVGGYRSREVFAWVSVNPEPEVRFIRKKGLSCVVDSRSSSTERNSRNMNTLMNTLT